MELKWMLCVLLLGLSWSATLAQEEGDDVDIDVEDEVGDADEAAVESEDAAPSSPPPPRVSHCGKGRREIVPQNDTLNRGWFIIIYPP